MVESFMYAETLSIAIIVIGILFFASLKKWQGKLVNPLSIVYITTMICAFSDIVWSVIQGRPEWAMFLNVWECVYFILLSVIEYAWFEYVATQLPFKLWKNNGQRILYAIPALVCSTLSIVSAFNGCVFDVDLATGVYTRGPLLLVHSITSYIYPLASTILSIVAIKHSVLKIEKRSFVGLASFPIMPLLCSLIQTIQPVGLPVTFVGIAISLLVHFIIYCNNTVSRDVLTNLPNRYSFDNAINEKINKYKGDDGEKKLYLITGDLDSFKLINDRFGHLEGDRALQIVGNVLYQVTDRYGAYACRTGGDEFAILVETKTASKIDAIISSIDYLLDKHNQQEEFYLHLSTGVAQYQEGMDIQQFFNKSDKDCYINKNRYKQTSNDNIAN